MVKIYYGMKTFISIGLLVIVLVALMFWGVKGSNTNYQFELGVLNPVDQVRGNASSSVVLMEYSDFQCPACRTYYSVLKELEVEFGDKVAFVYRHFPLTSIHPNAEFAARAAEAAGKQGKFWQMHDLLFEKQSEWSGVADIGPLFENYAKLLGISVEKFKADWVSNEVKDLVRAERLHALKSGLQGTPSFFLNGKQIQNPSSVEAFKNLLREALKNS